MKRFALLLAPILLAAALVAAPAANATPNTVWSVRYGSAVGGSSPNVWSNRNPTWVVGTDPHLTAQTDGNFVDYKATCPGGVCWSTHTANVGPGPWQSYWDSRAGTSGRFAVYSSEGVIRFSTPTANTSDALMVFFDNGCLNIYSHAGGNWGWPIWSNSASSACSIYY